MIDIYVIKNDPLVRRGEGSNCVVMAIFLDIRYTYTYYLTLWSHLSIDSHNIFFLLCSLSNYFYVRTNCIVLWRLVYELWSNLYFLGIIFEFIKMCLFRPENVYSLLAEIIFLFQINASWSFGISKYTYKISLKSVQ